MVPIRYNIRSLFVRKVTTIATALGIALVVFVFAAALMLAAGVEKTVTTGGRDDTVIILRKGSDAELASAIPNDVVNKFLGFKQIKQDDGVVKEIIIVITAERNDGSGQISNLLIRGTSDDGIKFRPEIKIVSGREPKPGTNEVMIGRAVSGRFLGVYTDPATKKPKNVVIAPGATFDVRYQKSLIVVGEFTANGSTYESEVIGDLDRVRDASGRELVVSSVRLRLNSADDYENYRRAIEENKEFSMKVKRETDYFADQSEQTTVFLTRLGTIIAVLFAIAAMIGAAITMNAAVANRSREIGTLRALGFSRASILFAFLLEALVLAVIGGVIGSALVLLLSFASFPVINFQTFSEMVIEFTATPGVFLASLLFACVMGLLGGLVPAIRASQISPVEAMRA